MAKPIDEITKTRIVELYKSGLAIATIHLEIGVSKPTISKILKQSNIDIRIDNGQSLNIDWDQVNIEYDSGVSTYDLAEKYGCSDETIRKKIKKIRSESDRNVRSELSKKLISESCKKKFDDQEYVEKHREGLQRWIDSGGASNHSAKHYDRTLGKWIKSEEGRKALSETQKSRWQNQQLKECYLNSINNKANVQSRIAGTRRYYFDNVDERSKEFLIRSEECHGDKYDYSEVIYVNSMTPVTIICSIHGEFRQRPNHHTSLMNGCPSCPTIISQAHKQLTQSLPSGVKFVNNNRSALNGLEIDIYCPKHNFGIEVHGAYWHSCRSDNADKHDKYARLHQLKASIAEENNITLYQFWDFEIKHHADLINSMISNALGCSERVYARKCRIKKIDNNQAKSFFDRSHLQGHRNARHTYALVLDEEIQCAVSFSKHSKHEWEIIRFACAPGKSVVGGFSKLFKRFVIDEQPNKVLTFADRRFSIGKLYSSNGFQKIEDTRPNYFYFKNGQILSRQSCQKHKLPKLLGTNFNPKLSEFENMLQNGFGRIYDAGHRKMLWFS